MRHLIKKFFYINYRYTPSQKDKRYNTVTTLGQDDFGNAIPVNGSIYFPL